MSKPLKPHKRKRSTSLFLFAHFHKAGGTSIAQMAKHMKLTDLGGNGNPGSKDSLNKQQPERFWIYPPILFDIWKKKLINHGVQFVAMEWGMIPRLDKLNMHDVHILTCLRDPYERFISDFNVAQNRQFKGSHLTASQFLAATIKVYGETMFYNKYNFYTRMLCGGPCFLAANAKLTQDHFLQAKRNLLLMDTITILEIPESFNQLYNLGFQKRVWANKNTSKRRDIGISKTMFEKRNAMDYELYNLAKRIWNNPSLKHKLLEELTCQPFTLKHIIINLDERKDRWQRCQSEMPKFLHASETFERFSAIKTSDLQGCTLSFMAVLKKYANEKQVMIYEDDVMFRPNARQVWDQALEEVPDDWDVILGGCSKIYECQKVSEHVYKVKSCATHACLMKPATCLPEIKRRYGQKPLWSFDKLLHTSQLNIYVCKPFMSYQYPGFSDLSKKEVDFISWFEKAEAKLS